MNTLGRMLLLVVPFMLAFILLHLLVHGGEGWMEEGVKGGLVGLLFSLKLGWNSTPLGLWRHSFGGGERSGQ